MTCGGSPSSRTRTPKCAWHRSSASLLQQPITPAGADHVFVSGSHNQENLKPAADTVREETKDGRPIFRLIDVIQGRIRNRDRHDDCVLNRVVGVSGRVLRVGDSHRAILNGCYTLINVTQIATFSTGNGPLPGRHDAAQDIRGPLQGNA